MGRTLADDLLEKGPVALTRSGAKYLREGGMKRFHASLREAVRIDVDPVADYWTSLPEYHNLGEWSPTDEHRFPNLAPPYEIMWMEHRRPRNVHPFRDVTEFNRRIGHVHTEDCFQHPVTRERIPGGCPVHVGFPVMPERTGVLIEAHRVSWERYGAGRVIGESTKGHRRTIDLISHTPEDRARVADNPEYAAFPGINEFPGRDLPYYWLLLASVVMDADGLGKETDHRVISPTVRFHIDPDGRPLTKGLQWDLGDMPLEEAHLGASINTLFSDCFPVFLLALSFMHCKNVTVDPEPPAPPKWLKAYTKRHGKPPLRFHTLTIEPMRRVLRDAGAESPGTGLHKAMHIARGHFGDYREGRGLFGKHHGIYWWDAQVRGSYEEGVVTKDYRIKAPKP